MKHVKFYILSGILIIFHALCYGQHVRYAVTDSTKMTVSGTSTLHDWTSKVTIVKGFVELDEKFAKNGKVKQGEIIELVSLEIPVKSIISPRGATMDKKTYDALKSEEHPNITFKLENNQVTSVNGEKFMLNANGRLTIAGVSKVVQFPVEGRLISDQRMGFTGAYKLNMKEYEMEPPSAMFGQIVTGEEVEIKFDLVVNK